MIWLLTALLVVALIFTSLRFGAWYLLNTTPATGIEDAAAAFAPPGPDQGTTAQ
jgi:hypothetical protein